MTDWNQLENCASGDPRFVNEWRDGVRDMRAMEDAWISGLIAKGFKAAHPNDGWVNREENYFQLCYPRFDMGVTVGTKVMLGSAPPYGSERPVVVTHIERKSGPICGHWNKYHFVDATPAPDASGEGEA